MVDHMLSVQGLCVAYGQVKAVHEVNLQVNQGETVTLLGVNGAGKTTVLLALAGVLKPVSGTILYDCGGGAQTAAIPHAPNRLCIANAGQINITNMSVQQRLRIANAAQINITNMSVQQRLRMGISLVPEGRHVFSSATVHENLLIGAHIRKDRQVDADIERMYRLFPALYEKRNSTAMSLSGGQQQMLAIARAIMSRPRLLLLDEPTMGLSPKLCAEVYAFIEKGSREGLTVLVSGEDGRSLRAICSRALTIVNGVLHS